MRPQGFSIVIPAYNAEATLRDTLQSVSAQSYSDWEALVIDDGSTDRTRDAAQKFASADRRLRIASQANGGESAARNAGLARAARGWVVFLDADDWIFPTHLERIAAAIEAHPEADVVHTGWMLQARNGQRSAPLCAPPPQALFPELTRRNCFAIHACAVRKSVVESVGGFDVTLKTCPDWDLWQRVARAGCCFVAVREVLACYCLRPGSAGTNAVRLLADALTVIERGHEPDLRVPSPAAPYARGMPADEKGAAKLTFLCWAAGLAIGRGEIPSTLFALVQGVQGNVSADAVTEKLFEAVPRAGGHLVSSWPDLWQRAEHGLDVFLAALEEHVDQPGLALQCKSSLMRRILTSIPIGSQAAANAILDHTVDELRQTAAAAERRIEELRTWIAELEAAKNWHDEQRLVWHRRAVSAERALEAEWAKHGAERPAKPTNPFGHPRCFEPVSREWGFDRGLPVDRYYIEQFLARHSTDINGRVLEIGDDTYTRRFGGDRVLQSDVLDIDAANRKATLVADLARADQLATGAFDCIILTQTLQLIYDVPAALRTLHRILRAGGVLLATFPGLTRTSHTEWPGSWYWRLTPASTRRLFESQFSPRDVELGSRGNVLAASAFLYGLAAEELTESELECDDPDYDVIITVRARKERERSPRSGSARIQRDASTAGPDTMRALVLLYHRIEETDVDPWELSVSPRHFDEQMRVLQRTMSVVRLQDVTRTVTTGESSGPVAVITFDDGYADNRHHALPVLQQYALPATVFICTDPVEHQSGFWWDTLERLLLWPGELPSTLHIDIAGKAFRCELGESAKYSIPDFDRHRSWRAWEPCPTQRHKIYTTLWQRLYELGASARARVIADLSAWAGHVVSSRPGAPALGRSDVKLLAQSPLVDIGAHTVHHPALAMLTVPEQQAEISDSRKWLELLLDMPVTSFSYPFGRALDYSSETVRLVRESGFTAACANVSGAVRFDTDPLQLPRFQVKDWDGSTFERHIQQWMAG